ncbi:DNA polymerase III subunit epsilon [Gallionella capsiferriformans]|jgi:DNA polymerase-3 subunit epsilon|uniref:DNA polymerase III subunit epsilon n=1 Tax=Gallionella capsiferriformans (strain ES-2) TaxID=395494 RepID=D9SFS2_GALCS|nr:DNA polymerase III subunit epsilon [Gallionella capsiferriformans]ADL55369.1 DNA polymerase III, epsilon subunit [Gallionella capsiferriformans ES-2]
MRKIVLDTETTGLDPKKGHRIIEIAAIALEGRKVSKRHFHHYLDPEREVDEDAARVHGFTWDMLKGRAKFADIATSFLEFVDGAELMAHNAPFDMSFINNELRLLGLPPLENPVVDTLKMAREMHPGKKNGLDALCSRYEIDNTHRTLHGALLDTELLAEVYFAMTRGQESLLGEDEPPAAREIAVLSTDASRPTVRVLLPSPDELAVHAQQLLDIDKASKGACLWTKLESAA